MFLICVEMPHSQLARVYAELFATVVVAQNGAPDCQVLGAVDVAPSSLNAVLNSYDTMYFL